MTRRIAAKPLLAIVAAWLLHHSSVQGSEECQQDGSCSSRRPSVTFLAPQEGEDGDLAGADVVKIALSVKDFTGTVGIYLDGKLTKSEKYSGGELNTGIALGRSPQCGEWHMLEAVLMDEEGWRLENSEAEAAVRFRTACPGDSVDGTQAAASERANAFATIFETYGWEPPEGTKETRSGPGSYLSRTATSREFLAQIIKEYNIKSIFDAGCGDVNWQRHVSGIDEVEYHGVDIVPEMIEANKKDLADRPKMTFSVHDVVAQPLDRAYDLIICRDTLFHLPLFDAVNVLRHFDASGSKFLLSHFEEASSAAFCCGMQDLAHNWPDIEPGQWHMINLLAAPFKLPPPIKSVPETGDEGTLRSATHYGHSRQLALWQLPVLSQRAAAGGGEALPAELAGLGAMRRCVVVGEHSPAPHATAPFDVVLCLGAAPHSYVTCHVRVAVGEAAAAGDGAVAVRVGAGEGRAEEREVLQALAGAGAMECASVLLLEDAATDLEERPGGPIDAAAQRLWAQGVYVFSASKEEPSPSSSPSSPSSSSSSGPQGEEAGARSSLLPVQLVNAFADPRFPADAAGGGALPRVLCVIPARYGSQRLGGKLLRELKGRTVLERTHARARQAKQCSRLVVATEDERIKAHVEGFGGTAVLTRAEWKSGTDRVFEAWRRVEEMEGPGSYQIVVNVQGDEPLLDPAHVDAAAQLLLDDTSAPMSTLAAPILLAEAQNQAVVKVVTDAYGNALYFSRALIPSTKPSSPPPPTKVFKRHIGIYGFRTSFLETYVTLPFSDLQGSEDLEQLKVLSAGFGLRVAMVDKAQPDVNTEEDIKVLESML